MRDNNISVAFSILAALLCLHGLDTASVLNSCHEQCRAEEELKATCKIERNCESLLPNFDAFLNCLRPCREIGNNCFQRCAFKTDDITNACLRHCNMISSIADVSDSSIGVSGAGTASATTEVSSTGGNGNGNGNGNGSGSDVSSNQREVGGVNVNTNNNDNNIGLNSGTLCYRSCYDHMLNSAMNRLYRKRPVQN